MLAYNKELLENGLLVTEAKQLFKMKFISKEQLNTMAYQLPQLQSSTFFIRFGFFVLGLFLFSSITGFLSLFFANIMSSNYEILIYIYAIIGLVGSEFFARKLFFKHGLDDAFVLSWQGAFCAAIGVSFESVTLVFAVLFVVAIFSCIRYVNTISALLSGIGVVGFFFTLITELKVISSMYLPFVGLILAISFYAIYHKLNLNSNYFIYRNALQLTKMFSLVLGYAAVNYMVVRELSESLMGVVVAKGNDIPLAYLFYGLTFGFPLAYIYYALQKKDRTILTIGLLALSYSFFTIRFYYSLMPLEVALLLGGVLLFVFSFLSIKKLQHKTSGITFQPDREANRNSILNVQALIVNSQISTQPVMDDSKMPFGGGGFSGGGAGASF